MKFFVALFLFVIVSTTICYGQSIQRFSAAEIRADIDTLVKYLEATHPNPYYRYPKERFYKDVQNLKTNLTGPMDLVGFYLAAEPLLAKLEDGHTDFHINKFYNSQNPFVLPYYCKLSVSNPFITCNGPYQSVTAQLPPGCEIISINNVPAKKIVTDIVNLNTGESPAFRADFGASRFSFYLEALYKANGTYHVQYKSKGIIKNTVINGIRKDVIDERLKKLEEASAGTASLFEPNFTLQLLEKDKTAIINFKSFDWDGFPNFTDSAFTVIKQKSIENLIINLIDDGGGDSDVGDAFFQFILNKPFKQYDKVLGKNSRLLKERLMEHKANKPLDPDDSALLAKVDGSFDTTFYDDISIGANPNRFNGNVYVLTNSQTYSSAADFAQCFKHYKRGMIVGGETGGLVKSYGDIVTTTLPNTHLEIAISSKLYYDAGATENDWHGVMPDKLVQPNMALAEALEIIRNANKRP